MLGRIGTLIVSHAYEPLTVISWQRALKLLTLGKVEVLEEYDQEVHSFTVVFKVPAVVRLLRVFRRFRRPVKFSRANVYARDRYRCQYCGTEHSLRDLNLDHVIPRAQGGTTHWDNIVTSCLDCNLRKGNRTPAQAGMKLLSEPKRPDWIPAVTITVNMHSIPDAWRDYLYWMSELQE